MELEFSKGIERGTTFEKLATSQAKNNSYWQNRGPFNVGGRTRALAIDPYDERVILAGGVSGGLWRSEDAGQTWRKVTRSFQRPSITCIVQDPRPNRRFTWYYGTGERFGNSAGAGGAFFQGNGIYRSSDNGRTWELLRATDDRDPGTFSPLDLINSIAVNPVNGHLYVGTFDGVLRSKNGRNNFEEVLAGGFDNTAEVAITPSGRIYATIDSGGDPNAGFFTSTDGDNWTNITPPNFVPAYGRTVMAIDPSDENRVFFFTQNLSGGTPALLFRYDATAATLADAWTDLTANLPSGLGNVGNINLQGGYNMVVEVSPNDPDLVFVGGTNLYRSTDGFTTPTGIESWIGGYSPATPTSFQLYTDQHP